MFSIKADNIYDIAQPLHYCSRLFGLTSFSIRYEDKSLKASTDMQSVISFLFSFVWSSSYIVLFFMLPRDDLNIYKIWVSEFSEIGMAFLTFGFIISSNVGIWWTFFAKHHFSKLFNLIVKMDEDLLKIKHSLNFKQHKKIIWVFVTIIKLLLIYPIFSTSFLIRPMNLSILVCVILTTFLVLMNILVIFHFLFWIWAIKIRYVKVNSYLEENFSDVTKEMKKLNISAKFHATLVDSSEIINRCYGVPVKNLIKKKEISF